MKLRRLHHASTTDYIKPDAPISPDPKISECLNCLKTGNPADLELAFTLGPTAQFFEIEVWCHRRLTSKRLEGEWFHVSKKKAVETVKRAERAVAMTRPRPGAAVFWAKAIGLTTVLASALVVTWAFVR